MSRPHGFCCGRTSPMTVCSATTKAMAPLGSSRHSATSRTDIRSMGRPRCRLRASRPAHLPARARWQLAPPGRNRQRQAAQFSERCGGQIRRNHLINRPVYGIDSHYEGMIARPEIGGSHVYRLDESSGAASAVITDLIQPNGLAFSPDESISSVGYGASHVRGLPRAIKTYGVAEDGRFLRSRGTLAECEAGFFDGLRVDRGGNIWASSADAVRVSTLRTGR